MKKEEILKALIEKFGSSETPVTVYAVAKCEASFDSVSGYISKEVLCYFLYSAAAREYRIKNYPKTDISVTATLRGGKRTSITEYYVDEQHGSYNETRKEYDFLDSGKIDCFSEIA